MHFLKKNGHFLVILVDYSAWIRVKNGKMSRSRNETGEELHRNPRYIFGFLPTLAGFSFHFLNFMFFLFHLTFFPFGYETKWLRRKTQQKTATINFYSKICIKCFFFNNIANYIFIYLFTVHSSLMYIAINILKKMFRIDCT